MFVAILKTTQRCYSSPAKYTMANRVHHFKLVLLGDTAVGKSCLVVRFVRDEFFEFQEPTIGGVCNDDIVDGIHYHFYVIPTRHEIQQECFKESGANLQKWRCLFFQQHRIFLFDFCSSHVSLWIVPLFELFSIFFDMFFQLTLSVVFFVSVCSCFLDTNGST
jgi:hypothetical protein